MTGFVTAGEGSDNVLVPGTHENVDHTAAPMNLLDGAVHDARDHSSVNGVPAPEAFTSGVHLGTNHTGIPGVGDLSVLAHSTLDHLGITGVGGPVQKNNTPVGNQATHNFIEGTGTQLTIVNDSGNNRINITITTLGGLTSIATNSQTNMATISINPGFVPRLGFTISTFTVPFIETAVSFGVFAGTALARQLSIYVRGSVTHFYGPGYVIANTGTGWRCNSFTSSSVLIQQVGGTGTVANADTFIIGGG